MIIEVTWSVRLYGLGFATSWWPLLTSDATGEIVTAAIKSSGMTEASLQFFYLF